MDHVIMRDGRHGAVDPVIGVLDVPDVGGVVVIVVDLVDERCLLRDLLESPAEFYPVPAIRSRRS